MALALVFASSATGCNDADPAQQPKPAPKPLPSAFELGQAAPVPTRYVRERVDDTKKRLERSEAGRLILSAIKAHGGLAFWYGLGTMEFTFNYQPEGQPERVMKTRQKVDLWRAHAYHEEVGEGADARFAFDGKRAWITPNDKAFPSTARFWSLTPYYFVSMPFVLADPGVKLEKLDDAELDGEVFDMVKASYEQGVGDAPDDYYILYLSKATHRVRALRYIVSYPGFFEKGKHSPEKLMHFDRYRDEPPILAQQLDTYEWIAEKQKPGALKTVIEVRYHAFGQTFDPDWLAPPEGAVVTDSVPVKRTSDL